MHFISLIFIILSFTLCSSFLIKPEDLQIKYKAAPILKEIKKVEIYSRIDGLQVVGEKVKVIATLDNWFNQTISVQLVCDGAKCEKILGRTRFEEQLFDKKNATLEWELVLKDNGIATLMLEHLNSDEFIDKDIEVNNGGSLIQLKVGKSVALDTWSKIIGYIYFVAWMLSLYPILITNFRNKSVTGLNLDFVGLNTTGYLFYAIYNISLYYIDEFQEVYFQKYPGSQIPVQFNDVLFATHGFVVNVLICLQCVFYERGDQVITNKSKAILIALYSPALVLTYFYMVDGINKYLYITFFSYCKLLLTLFKYIPQAYYNYKRKSTKGWSVVYSFLDFTGGSFSILQMLLNSINQDDYRNFTGNAGKLGLGLVSILFDILFMIQHFVLYRHRDEPILTTPSIVTYGSRFDDRSTSSKNSSNKKYPLNKSIKKDITIDNLNNNNNNNVTLNTSARNQGMNNKAFVEN